MREDHKLQVSESEVLAEISGLKTYKFCCQFRLLQKEGTVSTVVTVEATWWPLTKYVPWMGWRETSRDGDTLENGHLNNREGNGRTTSAWILERWVVRKDGGWNWLIIGSNGGLWFDGRWSFGCWLPQKRRFCGVETVQAVEWLEHGLDNWGIGLRCPAGIWDFSLLHSVKTGSETQPTSCPMSTGALSQNEKSRNVKLEVRTSI
jgi:hypothetical protein